MGAPSDFDALRIAFNSISQSSELTTDYEITNAVGHAFVGRSRSGAPTLLIPLQQVSSGLSRSGGGFSLIPAERVEYEFSGRKWEQPSAALECTERELLDAFVVLCADLLARLSAVNGMANWFAVTKWVDEWQALLGKKPPLTPEQELGLWGELWLVAQSRKPDELVNGWRGPERENVDFFFDGVGVEVKTSRRAHAHFVSQKQITRPVGDFDAYLLSIWVAPEPVRGKSLVELADDIMSRTTDGLAFLKQLGRLGFSPYDRNQYRTRFVSLDVPKWFRADSVPRVRAADEGISNLRYQIILDVEAAADEISQASLWQRLVGDSPTIAQKEGGEP
jgi:hypothetical protein